MAKTRRVPVGKKRAAKVALNPRAPTPRMEAARFVGIDLVVTSRSSLAPLVSALPRAYQPLGLNGRPMAGLLVLNGLFSGSAEAACRQLLKRLEALKGAARNSWRHAARRVFDFGVQAGSAHPPFEEVQLSPTTLARIAALGVTIQITIYPLEPEPGNDLR